MLGLGKKKTRKKKGDETTTESTEPVEIADAEQPVQPVTASSAMEPITPPVTVTETPIPLATTADAVAAHQDGEPQAEREVRGQFRSWVTDTDRGYSRLTDEANHRIVAQFEQRPPADVLTALKDGGFRFQPDYCGQKNAWVRRNDFEGRIQVEAMEKLFKELVPGKESPDR